MSNWIDTTNDNIVRQDTTDFANSAMQNAFDSRYRRSAITLRASDITFNADSSLARAELLGRDVIQLNNTNTKPVNCQLDPETFGITHWTTMGVTLVLSTVNSDAGDQRFRYAELKSYGDGDDLLDLTGNGLGDCEITMPGVTDRVVMLSSESDSALTCGAADELWDIGISRNGQHANDTSVEVVYLLAVIFTQAS